MSRRSIMLTLFLVVALVFWICAVPGASAQQDGRDEKAKDPPKRAAAGQTGEKKPAPPGKRMSIEDRLERLEKAVRELGAAVRRNRLNRDNDRPRSDEPGRARAGRKGGRGAPSAEEQGRGRAGRIDPGAAGRGRQGAQQRGGTVRRRIPDDRSDAGGRPPRPPVRRPGEWARENPEKARELRERVRGNPELRERIQKRMQDLRRTPPRGQRGAARRLGDDARRPLEGLKRAEVLRKLKDLRILRERLEQHPELQKRLRERIRSPGAEREPASPPPQGAGS